MTEKTYDAILDRLEDVYGPIVKKSYGARLNIRHLWKHPAIESNSMGGDPRSWNITIYGGLARYPSITPEALALAACHELGHHIGGFPKDHWATNEGAADYFATLKCLRLILPADKAMDAVDPIVRRACADVFPEGTSRNLCEIESMAALALAVYLQETDHIPQRPSFSTPDPSVVSETSHKYPAVQCRLDTLFQGALCAKAVEEDLSDVSPAPGACTSEQGFTVGLRPPCWFKPPPLNAVLDVPTKKQPDLGAFEGLVEKLRGAFSGRGL